VWCTPLTAWLEASRDERRGQAAKVRKKKAGRGGDPPNVTKRGRKPYLVIENCQKARGDAIAEIRFANCLQTGKKESVREGERNWNSQAQCEDLNHMVWWKGKERGERRSKRRNINYMEHDDGGHSCTKKGTLKRKKTPFRAQGTIRKCGIGVD